MKKLIFFFFFSSIIMGCNLGYLPKGELSEGDLDGFESLQSLTNGTYSVIKDINYVRLRHFTQELPGDEVAWCKPSGDNLQNAYAYNRLINSNSNLTFWRNAYYGIYQANRVIESIPDNADPDELQLKGENLFLRALMHLDLAVIFARPYTQNDPSGNLGVVLMDNTQQEDNLPSRSSVKDTYDFILDDLLTAADLMNVDKPGIYGTKEAAWALLSRVYLYMGNNDKSIEFADMVINSHKFELVKTQDLSKYYTLVPENNPETIFAIKVVPSENRGKSSIGSLYQLEGWGEIYVSSRYRKLIYRNPNDQRISFIQPDYELDQNGDRIPDSGEECGFKVMKREGYSRYFMLKYTGQEGISMLSSPVVIRLAEVYLNKAEALAKIGDPSSLQKAIDLVNLIRERAGLSEDQLFSLNDLKGYSSVLDVVLDERNLELAFEGHRKYDLFRNNRTLIRDFTHKEGWAGPATVDPTSNIIVEYIPEVEADLNPNLKQNP